MKNFAKRWKEYRKAIGGFVVAFAGSLLTSIQATGDVDRIGVLVALLTAITTGGTVYQLSNKRR